jgi:hypothetical protein
MVTVPPETPVSTPAVPMVAIAVFALLHAPPVDISLSVVLLPAHGVTDPVIAAGNGLTVATTVTLHPEG